MDGMLGYLEKRQELERIKVGRPGNLALSMTVAHFQTAHGIDSSDVSKTEGGNGKKSCIKHRGEQLELDFCAFIILYKLKRTRMIANTFNSMLSCMRLCSGKLGSRIQVSLVKSRAVEQSRNIIKPLIHGVVALTQLRLLPI